MDPSVARLARLRAGEANGGQVGPPAATGMAAGRGAWLDELLASVATASLPGHEPPFPGGPLQVEPWEQLLNRCSAERLQGHLLAAIDGGRLPATTTQVEQVRDLHLRSSAQVLRLERRLLELSTALEPEGIDLVVLKGSAHAHLDYPDPALRMFGDVDVLVRGDDLAAACTLLSEHLSTVRERPELRRGYDRRFTKSIPLRCPDGIEIDLHRHLLFGTFSFAVDPDELFASAVPFALGGRRLLALGPEVRAMHACYHAALGDRRPRYASLRDVAQMLTADALDGRSVVELAARWRSLAVLQRAVTLCRQVLEVEIGGPVGAAAASCAPGRRERRAIRSYVGANRSYASKVIASLPYLEGGGERAAFLTASTLPSRAFVDRGQRGRLRWLRKGARALRRSR